MGVFRLDAPGRVPIDVPTLSGHAQSVTDFDFNPFSEHILATGSEDMLIKLWQIPEGGLTSNVTESLADLHGHSRKVTLLRFHPTAGTVLASAAADNTVKIWDAERATEMVSINDAHEQLIQDLVWDVQGNQFATSSKDKNVRIFDARSGAVTSLISPAHEGAKSIKLAFLGHSHKLFSAGFSKTSQRQLKIWDERNTSKEVFRLDLDTAAGVIMPFFDLDTHLIYLAGKGDGNVRVFEVSAEGDSVSAITEFRSNVSAKGMAMVPKRGLNVLSNETARLLKLTTSSVEPLSFIVPRKAEGFQEDIFPDTFSGEASQSAEEWLAGSDEPLRTKSLNPAASPSAASSPTKAGSSAHTSRAFSVKTVPVLLAELEAAQARIKVLEGRLQEAGLSIE